jgi:hypothetical protein
MNREAFQPAGAPDFPVRGSDLQRWTRIRAMNLPQWRVSVLDCASPLALSMTHDLQSGSGLPHSKTWRSYQRFMGRAFLWVTYCSASRCLFYPDTLTRQRA